MSGLNFSHPADEITLSVSEGLILIDAKLHRAGNLVRQTVVRAKEVKIEHGRLNFVATTPFAEAHQWAAPPPSGGPEHPLKPGQPTVDLTETDVTG